MKVYIVELADGRAGTRRVELPKGPLAIEFVLGEGNDRDVISVPLSDDGDGLEIRCPEGRLVIKPDVSNQMTVTVENRFGVVSHTPKD
jgi:hypothetical protein